MSAADVSADPVGYIGVCVFLLILAALVWGLIR